MPNRYVGTLGGGWPHGSGPDDLDATTQQAGTYYAELWRTDVGALQLLSFGDVVIR